MFFWNGSRIGGKQRVKRRRNIPVTHERRRLLFPDHKLPCTKGSLVPSSNMSNMTIYGTRFKGWWQGESECTLRKGKLASMNKEVPTRFPLFGDVLNILLPILSYFLHSTAGVSLRNLNHSSSRRVTLTSSCPHTEINFFTLTKEQSFQV